MARKGSRKRSKSSRGGKQTGLWSRLKSVTAGFLFGKPVAGGAAERLQEIKGLLLIGFSIWVLLSMLSYYTPRESVQADGYNWGGRVGFYLADWALIGAGLAGYVAGLLGVAWGVVMLARKKIVWPALRIFGGLCFVASVAFLLELALGTTIGAGSRLPHGPGGFLALKARPGMEEKFGVPGLWILLLLVAVISFMVATEMAFYPAIRALRSWIDEQRSERGGSITKAAFRWFGGILRGLWDFLRGADLDDEGEPTKSITPPKRSTKKKPARESAAYEEEEDEDEEEEDDWEYEDEEEPDEDEAAADDEWEYEDEDEEEWEEEEEPEPEPLPEPVKAKPKKEAVKALPPREVAFENPKPPAGPWTYPSLDLLRDPEATGELDDSHLQRSADKLENALKSFRVEAEVVAAQVGPAVTVFELTVSQGTRMNKVTQLSQEIAAALQARSVRIIAPIPGRSTIGVEVPNKKRRIVRLRELIHKKAYDKTFMALPMFLGMDAEGTPIVEDLSRMPHLLIAGTTGSGKSVCINTILASLLLTRSPHDVQMILVDPKMVELQVFSRVPHLLLPVVTDSRQATNVLLWLCEKMEGRYELMKDASVKNIKGYNKLGEEGLKERLGEDFSEERTPRHLTYIVVVIDEMADLMMVSKKEAEHAITRLAQKSRAVGIHVIVATQRPSTDVITGVIKGNLPTRIAFQVASKVDSRVILDQMGAEKLLGGGDMLYTPPQSSQIRRVQGALVEDDELGKIVHFVCDESAPAFNQELVQSATGTAPAGSSVAGNKGPDDPMFDDAVRVVLKTKRGSASLLQRALSVGYTRASRLIDLMTEEGILGEHRGSKSRELMITLEDWEEMHGTPTGQGASDE